MNCWPFGKKKNSQKWDKTYTFESFRVSCPNKKDIFDTGFVPELNPRLFKTFEFLYRSADNIDFCDNASQLFFVNAIV